MPQLHLPRPRAVALATLAAPALLLAAAPPASAHPFGPPQTAEIAATSEGASVRWRFGAADDISYLAASLGALPEDRVLLDGVVMHETGDDALLARAAGLPGYATGHIRATRGGRPCTGRLRPVEEVATDGLVVDLACEARSGPVAITIDMLTDLHPAYRTLATGPGGQRAVYSGDAPRHDWRLAGASAGADPAGAGRGLGASAALQLGGVLGAAALLGAGGALLLRRRRRGSPSPDVGPEVGPDPRPCAGPAVDG